VKENSKKVLHTNYRSILESWLSTDQVGLSNNNPHWNLGFRFLFFPDLIQVLRDLKVTHPSLERLESDSSKSRETWKWLIQSLRDLKVTHQTNQPHPNPWRVRIWWRCSSEDRYTPILLQVWKSLYKVCGTLLHPPLLVSFLALWRVWSEKKFLPCKKSFLEDGVNYSVTRGLRTG
jgi:hypothetical protein